MNKIISKDLLTGDRFMPECFLRQPGFGYSPDGTFTKNKNRMHLIFLESEISWISRRQGCNAL